MLQLRLNFQSVLKMMLKKIRIYNRVREIKANVSNFATIVFRLAENKSQNKLFVYQTKTGYEHSKNRMSENSIKDKV